MSLASRDALVKTPELLYLLHGDPAELSAALEGWRAADVADALRDLPRDGAAHG